MTTRRFPPYGRELQGALGKPECWSQYAGTSANGQHLTIWIALGSGCWNWAKERRGKFLVLIAPPDDDARNYDWRVVAEEKHAPVLVQSCGIVEAEQTRGLVEALARDGVQRILFVGDKGLSLFVTEGCQDAA